MANSRFTSSRRGRFDDLGLRRALGDRMLPLLVAAMAFLAALALAGALAAAALAGHWQQGAATAMTVQVPKSTPARMQRALAVLRAEPGIASARALTEQELTDLLRPWLGQAADGLALPLPGVIEVHISGPGMDQGDLARKLDQAVPGAIAESHSIWVGRLSALANSIEACAWAALLLVSAVAACVVVVATRAGLAARREAIEIVHGLGATDGYIAGRFAGRVSRLAAVGGLAGAATALPVLLGLAGLAAPFLSGEQAAAVTAPGPAFGSPFGLATLPPLPVSLWLALPGLPLAAALIGFLTAQATVRRWLRRLP